MACENIVTTDLVVSWDVKRNKRTNEQKKNWNQIKNGWFHNFFSAHRSAERVKVKELEERIADKTVCVLLGASSTLAKPIGKILNSHLIVATWFIMKSAHQLHSSHLNWNLITVPFAFFHSPFVWETKTHSSLQCLADLDACFICARTRFVFLPMIVNEQ